jgi:hydrophobe/amphiphile efflux-1 (HAE1) family protein
MNIASTSINRPVFSSVLSIAIVIFGLVAFNFLGLREYPSVDPPIVTVSTSYVGANADVIENQITEPLEESINGISGIRSITSTSSDGRSNITVEFNLDVSMEAAANDVRDRVSRVIRSLPADCDPPVVVKADADQNPIIILAIQSENRTLLELSDMARNVFKERLQTIGGVSEVMIYGEKRYAMKLMLNPRQMSAYNLSPADIRFALSRENVELPSGRIEGYQTELTIRTYGRLTTVEEFDNLIIKEYDGAIVRLKDIGKAHLLPENERTFVRGVNGIPYVAVAMMPLPGSNHIAIADEFYIRLEQLKKEVPEDYELKIIMDTSKNIRTAITEVQETILIAFCLVVFIIFFFLRHWRTTLIPVIAIPISLIGAFAIMYLAGFSINILTLLAIVLATGLVVDDAIVVLENIYKKIESGVNPIKAGHEGSKEIFFAIISTTITLAVVFLPIIFLSGIVGRLFREFAIVVAGSVIISSFVSLSLTPMLSARFLKKRTRESRFFDMTERHFEWLVNTYNRLLTKFVNKRWLAIIIILISVGIIFGLGSQIPSELAPMEDRSRLSIAVTAPEGTAFEAMDNYMLEILNVLDTIPEKENFMLMTSPGWGAAGANTGRGNFILKPPTEREKTQQQLADELNAVFRKFNFARTFVTQEQTIGGGRRGGMPVQVVIMAPNFEKLEQVLPVMLDSALSSPAFQIADVNLKFNKPELKVEIDREKAKILGVSVFDIAQNLQLYFSGQRYGYFVMNEKQYQVIGQAERGLRDEPADLSSIYVRNLKGELIQLENVLRISEQSNPPQLYRYNRNVSATISATPASGLTLGQGIDEMQKIAENVLPDDFATALTGTSRDFAESSSSIFYALLFTLILVYLVLAAQFESYIDPLIIMFTVPLAISGAVLSLYIFGQTLNIFSQIGAIVLIGIVTKNGILIVEFANQRKAAGLSRNEAVIDAATQRLRPILMTSIATMLGALPIALALGAAAKSRVPMGITVIGGLLFSLILTLFVIPALYTYLSRDKKPLADIE